MHEEGCPDCESPGDEEEMTPEELVEAIGQLTANGAYEDAALIASVGEVLFERGFTESSDTGAQASPERALLSGRFDLARAELERCRGDVAAARGHIERAISTLEPTAAPGRLTLGSALYTAALIELQAGELEPAMTLLDRAADAIEGHDPLDRVLLAPVLTTMGELSLEVGEPDAAERLFGRGLEVLQEAAPTSESNACDLNAATGRAFVGLGGAAAQRGARREAKDYLARAAEFLDAGPLPVKIESLERIVELYRALGDESAAQVAEVELAAARNAVDQG
jgi:tetratricopeptide (TPR) repeat protein